MTPDPFAGHADQYRPLGGYAALMAAYNGLLAVALASAGRRGRLPERIAARDLVIAAIATFRVSRLIAKDRVTSTLRAPFTTFQGDTGHGEVDEAARGRGLRRAIGELLVCDFCLAPWVAAPLVLGLALAPRTTRVVAGIFSVHAAADVLQLGYSSLTEAG